MFAESAQTTPSSALQLEQRRHEHLTEEEVSMECGLIVHSLHDGVL